MGSGEHFHFTKTVILMVFIVKEFPTFCGHAHPWLLPLPQRMTGQLGLPSPSQMEALTLLHTRILPASALPSPCQPLASLWCGGDERLTSTYASSVWPEPSQGGSAWPDIPEQLLR